MTEPLMATGSALKIAHKLDNSQDRYPVLMSTAVTLVPRASKDLNAAYFNETEPGWARKRNPNLWMERFADQVPDDFLYIPESVIQAGQLQIGLDSQGALTLSHGESRKGLFEAELKSISANTLNTPERLVADAHWTARYNQAQIIRGLVQADYDQRQQGVQRWFYEAVAKNLPSILDDLLLANHARFLLPRTANGRAIVGVKSGKFRNIGYDYVIRTKQHGPDPSDKVRMEHLIGVTNKSAHQWDCYLQRDQHVHANLFITLSTETIYDIVAITGLALGDIPPELHTRGLGTYPANHNLERLDPLAKLRNPWDNLRLRFRLPVEYKAFKAYRSARGLKTPLTHELYAWGKAGGRLAHNEVMQSIGGNECGLGDEAWS